MNKEGNYVNCHACGCLNDVSSAIWVLNRDPNKDFAGTKCGRCKTIMTIVITERGVRQLELLISEYYRNGTVGTGLQANVIGEIDGHDTRSKVGNVDNIDDQADIHRISGEGKAPTD